MHEVDKLEKQWYRYRVKKTIYPLVGTLLVTGTIILGVNIGIYLDNPNRGNFTTTGSHKLTKVLGVSKINDSVTHEAKNSQVAINSVPKIKEEKIEQRDVFLEPTIPVIDMQKEEAVRSKKKPVHRSSRVKKVTHHSKHLVRAKPNSYLTDKELAHKSKVERVENKTPHRTKKIHFQTTTINYIDNMKEKFAKSNSSREALLLAKAFYKKGDYQNSESWALTANKLDSTMDESWFIFAKSKVKLGKKREALKILVSYYKKHHSLKAKELINNIKNGRV